MKTTPRLFDLFLLIGFRWKLEFRRAAIAAAVCGFCLAPHLTRIALAQNRHYSAGGRGQQPGYSVGSKWERNPSGDRYGNFGNGSQNFPHPAGGHGHGYGPNYNGLSLGVGGFVGDWNGGNYGWNPGYGFPYGYYPGGYPLPAPPAYIRNNDGALFVSPGFVTPYGVGPGIYGPGPWYGDGYGGYGPALVPVPGLVPSFMSFSFSSSGYGIQSRYGSSARYSVVPKVSSGIQPGLIPPGMKISPLPGNDAGFSPELGNPVPPIPDPIGNGRIEDGRVRDPAEDVVPAPADPSAPPIVDEFSTLPRSEKRATLEEKLQSIRSQANGDEAFRNERFDEAASFYESAIRSAPDRRAPYLRMAFTRISQAEFGEAASCLKTGLSLKSDSSRTWISAVELFGTTLPERIRSDSRGLWDWVAEKPRSTDRLMLMAAFQKWRGMNRTADDLLNVVDSSGADTETVRALQKLFAEEDQQAEFSESGQRREPQKSATDRFESNPTNASENGDLLPPVTDESAPDESSNDSPRNFDGDDSSDDDGNGNGSSVDSVESESGISNINSPDLLIIPPAAQ
jgi:hypothetical protein